MKINSGLMLLCASLLFHSSLSAAQDLTEQNPAKQDPAVQQKADAMINKVVVGEQAVRGVMHNVLKFQPAQTPQLTPFINKQTGQIAQMQRPYRKGTYYNTYFSQFTQNQGITYAAIQTPKKALIFQR
jgi:hypothetical protein